MRLRPRAEVICFKGNRVLCGYAPKGYVMFPGGGIDHKESAVAAAKRECMEECDRELRNCTPALEPTVQLWPEGYAEAKGNKWADGYEGGLTYWMTGSCSEAPIHAGAGRHPDYEACFDWKPIDEVLGRLARDMKGNWADDTKARIAILKTHQQMHRRHKEAQRLAPFAPSVATPALGASRA